MYRLKKHEVWASEIAEYLNSDLIGEDFLLSGPTAISTPRSLTRLQSSEQANEQILFLGDARAVESTYAGYINSKRPEVDLAHVLLEFFASAPVNEVHPTSLISTEAEIGRNVMIGANTVIGPDVGIGDNTKILNNVIINGPTKVGKYCVVKDGAVIGSEGYGFVEDEEGRPVHAPHFGRILIGDRVWIGSNGTIERAMIEDTIIEDDVKIDDLVHIGNGSRIGKKSMLTAGAVIAFDVVIGQKVTIAPNAVIRDSVTIADNVTVGQGAVVVKNLEESAVYVGVPAKLLKKIIDREG